MTTVGRKPGNPDVGFGEMLPGHARGSIVGRIADSGWLTSIGARLGRNTGTSATVQMAAAWATSARPEDFGAATQQFTVSTPMVDSWSGRDYVYTVDQPMMVGPGQQEDDYLCLLVCAAGASIGHGQDNSGWMMFEDNSLGLPLQDTWQPMDNARPEGKMSIWAEVTTNTRPATPTNLQPLNNAVVADTTPTLGCDFRDAEEVLPGFTMGQADKVSKYLFEIWNTAKTTLIKSSTILNATAAQQNARRVTWDSPVIGSGRYVARATVWDQFGAPSIVAEWTFTVSSGGTTTPTYSTGVIVGNDGRTDVTTNTSPGANVLWQSTDGASVSQLNVKILDLAGQIIEILGGVATPVRGPQWQNLSIGNGGVGLFSFGAWGWAGLPTGKQYSIYTQAYDSNGIISPWSQTGLITVDGAPGTPTDIYPPSGKSVTEYPVLSFTATDSTDDASTLKAFIRVRPVGGAEAGYPWDVPYNPLTGRLELPTNSSHFPVHGAYEWRGNSFDPWGQYGPYTAWTPINYVAPPVITITAPATDGASVVTGTPTITWTVDRTQVNYLLTLTEVDGAGLLTGEGQVYTSGTITTATKTFTVPTAKLHNGRNYRADITIGTSDGLFTKQSRTFLIAYPLLAPMTGITVTITPGPFEPTDDVTQWSRISIFWNQMSAGTVSDAEFRGYILRRTTVNTGETIILGHMLTRESVIFIDKTPASGEAYVYSVSCLVLRNAFDFIETAPLSKGGVVFLENTVIASMIDDSLGAVLPYWEEVEAPWVNDMAIVQTWGPLPIAFQGSANSTNISGTFTVYDDPFGTYLAGEIVTAVRKISQPDTDIDGNTLPHVSCFRDPKGRAIFAVITNGKEIDQYEPDTGVVALELAEIGVTQGVTLE